MPSYQQTKNARQKAIRIREVTVACRRERVERREMQGDIRTALQFGSASKFVAEVSR
jgi:hypothetical protein